MCITVLIATGNHKNVKQHNFDNNEKCFWAANRYIKMISEGSCDPEDWSNGCWNLYKLHL